MVRTIALLVVIIIFLRSWYSYRKVAQRRCAEFQSYIESHPNVIEDAIKEVSQPRKTDRSYPFVKKGEKFFLIEKGPYITIYSLNNDRERTMLDSQFQKLAKKLDKQNPAYRYSIESYSVYYRLPSPNENWILKINS